MKQERQILLLQQENSKLLERLLLKNGVPLAPEHTTELDPKAVERMISGAAMFEDSDDLPDEHDIYDNRKEKLDAFAS